MKAVLEREVKLRPGPEFSPVALSGRPMEERMLTSAYHDTEDLRLAAAGITLRRRTRDGDGGAAWQLKLPHAGDRLELAWEAPDERVPEAVRRLLLARTRGRPLVRVVTLRTRRSGVVVQDGGIDVAEVVQDAVEVLGDGGPERSFEELEVELLDGDAGDLRRLERRLRRAGAVDPDGRPKMMQALDLPPPGPQRAAGDTPAGHLVDALRAQYEEVLLRDPGTRLGTDPEELHDHRAAIRRLRALLRAGLPLVQRPWADGLRAALRPAGRALADVRDLDVLASDLARQAAALPEPERAGATDLLEIVRVRRDRAHRELRDRLCQPWYVSVLNRLEEAVAEPRLAGDGDLADVVRGEHRRARRLVRRLTAEPSDAELHEVRKAVKRARYAAELADAAGVGRMGRYVRRAKRVQDVLGEHQDAVVAAHVLEELDGRVHRPMAHMAAAALIDVQQERRADARAAFPKAWRKLQKQARRAVPA